MGEHLAVRFPEKTRKRIKESARAERVPQAEIVRRIVNDHYGIENQVCRQPFVDPDVNELWAQLRRT